MLNNRNYEQLLTLQPGVSYGNATSDQLYIGVSNPLGPSNQVQFSVNGGRPTANNWTIDGADNVDRGANLTLLAYPSVDAIAEVQTLRGTYEAEYGRSASAPDQRGDRFRHQRPPWRRLRVFPQQHLQREQLLQQAVDAVYSGARCCATTTSASRWAARSSFRISTTARTRHFSSTRRRFRRVVNYATATAYVPTAAESERGILPTPT